MKEFLLLMMSMIMLHNVSAQSDSTGLAFSFNGYLKDLNTFSFPIQQQKSSYTQLLHNRMNLQWTSTRFNASLEWRNRFFWGDLPKQDPMLARHLENANEKIQFPIVWTRNKNSLLHTHLERAWIEVKKKRWSYKFGRQRINWGMNNSWNPNDIFNAYNLLDFDYEERSGVDGFRVSHVLGEMRTIEWAGAFHRGKEITTAIKYGFHTKGVDWQFLTGIYRSMITFGGGWQGSMGDWGFKGELQYFGSHQEQGTLFNGSMEVDRLTPNNGYLYASILFTEEGLKKTPAIWTDLSFQNSPLKLMPAQWNLLVGFRKEISPRFNASIGLIHAPFVDLWILYPSVNFSVITNVDLDLFLQSFFGESNDSFGVMGHTLFLRGKWSF